MTHNNEPVNTMDQDVALGVAFTITQADLPFLRSALRLGEFPVVYRVHRMQKGGGFGDSSRHPFAWGILFYVDGQLARINSARGTGREWNDLDKVERWLRSQGFSYWWTRNDLEAVEYSTTEDGIEDAHDATAPETAPAHPSDTPQLALAKFSLK